MEEYRSPQDVLTIGKEALRQQALPDEFKVYLQSFHNNELSTGTAVGSMSYDIQHDRLIEAMRVKFTQGQGIHQVISQRDVELPHFFELMFTMHFLTQEIKLSNNLGYGPYEVFPGLSTSRRYAHAEFKIIDEGLMQFVSNPNTAATNNTYRAHVSLEDRIIYVTLDDGRRFRISRRQRVDMRPHTFIKLVLSQPRTNIILSDIKKAVDSNDITELVNQCGFEKSLKEIFFPGTTEQIVYFEPNPTLTNKEVRLLAEHRWK